MISEWFHVQIASKDLEIAWGSKAYSCSRGEEWRLALGSDYDSPNITKSLEESSELLDHSKDSFYQELA